MPSTGGRVEKSEERWDNNDPTGLPNCKQGSARPHGAAGPQPGPHGPAETGERSQPLTAQRDVFEHGIWWDQDLIRSLKGVSAFHRSLGTSSLQRSGLLRRNQAGIAEGAFGGRNLQFSSYGREVGIVHEPHFGEITPGFGHLVLLFTGLLHYSIPEEGNSHGHQQVLSEL